VLGLFRNVQNNIKNVLDPPERAMEKEKKCVECTTKSMENRENALDPPSKCDRKNLKNLLDAPGDTMKTSKMCWIR
jgi:hypothetical protein